MESLITLALATAILGLSPGPAVFATIGRSLSLKLSATYLFICGIVIGDLVFALLAMLGLAAIAAQYTVIFLLLKIIGGAYLIYLGYQSWRSKKTKSIKTNYTESGTKLISSGFLLTASNPKDLLFFISFLPAFMDLENTSLIEMTAASIVITITFFITLSVYALSANAARQIFKKPNAILYLNRISGTLLILVGLIVMPT